MADAILNNKVVAEIIELFIEYTYCPFENYKISFHRAGYIIFDSF